jgi:hyperosmotically inducible protein
MNKTLVALVAGTAMFGMAACSSTRTQRAPGEQVDDAALLTSVKSALASDPVTEAGEINVDVNRGVVKLAGFVDSSKEKSQAGEIARSVDGVQSVQNDIAVKKEDSSTGEVIDDSVITSKVKTALIADSTTKAHQINVETKGGVVQLSGFVDNAAAKSAATSVAKSVSGVKDVKNELSVKSY